jgi:HlyD family secretion protein
MKKYMKFVWIALAALVFIGTFAFLYVKSQPKVKNYTLETPKYGDIEKTTVVTGTIKPRDEILIKPQISGIVDVVYKKAGQMIRAGEVIAKVKVIPELGSLSSADSKVRTAQINYNQAKIDYDRAKLLYDKQLISKTDLETASLKIKTDKEDLNAAKEYLEITRDGIAKNMEKYSSTIIRSTITGLILDIPIKKGNSVIQANTMNDGTTIATIANMNDLIFDGNIDETEVGKLNVGMPIKLTIGALQNVKLEANLEFISPKGTETNGANLFEIKAAVRSIGQVQIRSGYSANAEIVLDHAQHVLMIPESTIEFTNNKSYAYVLTSGKDKKQTFKRKEVTLGLSDGINIEVKSGLTLKDKVRGTEITDDNKQDGSDSKQ